MPGLFKVASPITVYVNRNILWSRVCRRLFLNYAETPRVLKSSVLCPYFCAPNFSVHIYTCMYVRAFTCVVHETNLLLRETCLNWGFFTRHFRYAYVQWYIEVKWIYTDTTVQLYRYRKFDVKKEIMQCSTLPHFREIREFVLFQFFPYNLNVFKHCEIYLNIY